MLIASYWGVKTTGIYISVLPRSQLNHLQEMTLGYQKLYADKTDTQNQWDVELFNSFVVPILILILSTGNRVKHIDMFCSFVFVHLFPCKYGITYKSLL